MNKTDKNIKKIESLINRLQSSYNNLQYITRIKSLKKRLEDLYDSVKDDKRYSYKFEEYFGTSRFGISYYERICNAIEDYNYNNKPF